MSTDDGTVCIAIASVGCFDKNRSGIFSLTACLTAAAGSLSGLEME